METHLGLRQETLSFSGNPKGVIAPCQEPGKKKGKFLIIQRNLCWVENSTKQLRITGGADSGVTVPNQPQAKLDSCGPCRGSNSGLSFVPLLPQRPPTPPLLRLFFISSFDLS